MRGRRYPFRKPVGNQHARTYLLLMLIAFAFTVVVTRFFLELTGYPQLGNSAFHIAHALWGGLFLVVASLLMLIYVNRWLFTLAALLAGVGVGLFIDEVGKFITQNVDYFFPLAAPIIYAAFLLLVLLYAYLRRQKAGGARVEMYEILEDMQEILDSDLEASERADLMKQLKRLTQQSERPDLAALAQALLHFLESETVTVIPDQPHWIHRFSHWLQRSEDRWLSRQSMRRLLQLAFALLAGLFATQISALAMLALNPNEPASLFISATFGADLRVAQATNPAWFFVMIGLDALLGGAFAIALVALWLHHDKQAVRTAEFSLIGSLTFPTMLAFYLQQFSVIVSTFLLFLVLLLTLRYERRYQLS